jgi:ABC-2 type transport system ATP-binding protein
VTAVVETAGLTKRYGDHVAVDGLDLTVQRGEVVGFLGPNGAGKSTTLRMLLGLVRPTAGSATLFGEPPGTAKALAGVGALVETPAFYPYLTGRDNLRTLAGYAGVTAARVERVLDEVGLLERARDK